MRPQFYVRTYIKYKIYVRVCLYVWVCTSAHVHPQSPSPKAVLVQILFRWKLEIIPSQSLIKNGTSIQRTTSFFSFITLPSSHLSSSLLIFLFPSTPFLLLPSIHSKRPLLFPPEKHSAFVVIVCYCSSFPFKL